MIALPVVLLTTLLVATPQRSVTKPVKTPREARTIAEKDTGGMAVSVRVIHLNGATSGWEVDLHMPKEERGWRCLVDSDSHSVFSKSRIPNPPRPKAQR